MAKESSLECGIKIYTEKLDMANNFYKRFFVGYNGISKEIEDVRYVLVKIRNWKEFYQETIQEFSGFLKGEGKDPFEYFKNNHIALKLDYLERLN